MISVVILALLLSRQGLAFNTIPTKLKKTLVKRLNNGNHRHGQPRSRGDKRLSISITKMATMDSPSAERNKYPIWSLLSTVLNDNAITTNTDHLEEEVNNNKNGNNRKLTPYKVLEIAAGCGVHTLYFTSEVINNYPQFDLSWYPTDPDESSRCSIQDRIRNTASESVRASINPAVALTLNANGILEDFMQDRKSMGHDSRDVDFPMGRMMDEFNLMICINMIHISPWEATIGLMKVASTYLAEGGILYCYGPFKVDGNAVQSNLDFDIALKTRNSAWGIREKKDVIELATMNGLYLKRTVDMPANNLSLIFCKGRV